jgi:hypothetical protein
MESSILSESLEALGQPGTGRSKSIGPQNERGGPDMPGPQNERGGPRETSLRPGGPGGPPSVGLTYVSILLCYAHHDRPIDATRRALLQNRPFKSIVETFAQSDRPWTAGPRGPGPPCPRRSKCHASIWAALSRRSGPPGRGGPLTPDRRNRKRSGPARSRTAFRPERSASKSGPPDDLGGPAVGPPGRLPLGLATGVAAVQRLPRHRGGCASGGESEAQPRWGRASDRGSRPSEAPKGVTSKVVRPNPEYPKYGRHVVLFHFDPSPLLTSRVERG